MARRDRCPLFFVAIILTLMQLVQCNPLSLKPQLPRKLISAALSLSLSSFIVPLQPSIAAAGVQTYINERFHTSLNYPSGWVLKSGALPGERVVEAYVDPQDDQTSVSVVYTPIPADFTKLTSFASGNLRDYIIPHGEGITVQVLGEKTKGDVYTAEYVVEAPGV